MRPFTNLTGFAAALAMPNVDTDMILPADFLKTVSRDGLREGLFHRLRLDADGTERPEFVLNREPWRNAEILVTGANFGCGSSREHAPWALLDFGIRCIVAPSFAEIFAQNAMKNGMLLITLPAIGVDFLLEDAALPDRARMTVDLERGTITRFDGSTKAFAIDASRRARLLAGTDDIGLSLQSSADIDSYERAALRRRPWVKAIALP